MASRARRSPAAHGKPPRTPRSERLLVRLRAICLALPEAAEKLSHGEPTWFAGKGKVFAMFDDHHHGAAHISVWVPLPVGAQEALVASDPERFFRPPYVGPSGWVGVRLTPRPDWDLVAALVRDGFIQVAATKLTARLLQGGPESQARRSRVTVEPEP